MTDPRESTRRSRAASHWRTGSVVPAEEIQGWVERETTSVHVGGLTQYEGELSAIVVGDRHGDGKPGRRKTSTARYIHSLGVTDSG